MVKRFDDGQFEDENLNEQQRRAVAHACSQQLTLVQGPPGTGKSLGA